MDFLSELFMFFMLIGSTPTELTEEPIMLNDSISIDSIYHIDFEILKEKDFIDEILITPLNCLG